MPRAFQGRWLVVCILGATLSACEATLSLGYDLEQDASGDAGPGVASPDAETHGQDAALGQEAPGTGLGPNDGGLDRTCGPNSPGGLPCDP
jgi:hypothetical protein